MSITYEEALGTLEAMFGEPWNRETLDAVLRHEKGHMENTCERILNHSGMDPQILIDRLKSGGDDPQAAVDAALAQQLSQQQPAQGPPAPTNKVQRGKPAVLPDDFLRVPGYKYAGNRNRSINRQAPAADGPVDDETLARMLQDELFSEELARNPDFAHLARGRQASRTSRTGLGAAGSRTSHPPATRRSNSSGSQEGPKLMEKISELGDSARKRLALFATNFEQRLNSKTPATATGNGSFLNRGNLGYNAGAVAERRGLLDDDFEDTIEFETRKNQ